MRVVLLGLAAASAAALVAVVPANAQAFTDQGTAHHQSGFPRAVSPPGPFMSGDFRHHRGDRHHRRGRNEVIDAGWGWYDPNINRSWDSDSFNDWWHDRPDRAYPRWVSHNDNCERMFWVGEGWRCSM